MIQMPINLREPALNLRDVFGDRAGGQPLSGKDLRGHLREPARSNQVTRARETPNPPNQYTRHISVQKEPPRRFAQVTLVNRDEDTVPQQPGGQGAAQAPPHETDKEV